MHRRPAALSSPAVQFERVSAGRDIQVTVYQGPAYPRLDYLHGVSGLLAFYVERFVGREQEWEQIVDFSARAEPGYLLLIAEGGFGKSTFMAQLIHRCARGAWPQAAPNIIAFFIRAQGARNTPEAFLQAVNAQLLDLLDLPGGTPISLDELRIQFGHLWPEAVATSSHNAPLLLLIDGLDEMAPGSPAISDLLPSGLGPYVHVVVSSRPNPSPRDIIDREHPLRRADEVHLLAFDALGIHLLLQRYGIATPVAAELAPRVLKLTGGEPLYSRLACEEIGNRGIAALELLESNPPSDIENYFHDQLTHLQATVKGKVSWNILGLLVSARGSLSRREMAEVLELGPRDVRTALEPIERFLLRPISGADRFELFHRKLHDTLLDEFSEQELTRYRESIVNWCRTYAERGWPEKATPDYPLSHYAAHLSERGDTAALFSLINDRWMRIQVTRTRELTGFMRDVELARRAALAMVPQDISQIIRCCYIIAVLSTQVAQVPGPVLAVLASNGKGSEALGYLAMMDGERRGWACAWVAKALLDRGGPGDELLAQAADAFADGNSRYREITAPASLLLEIAKARTFFELIELSLRLALHVRPLAQKSEILGVPLRFSTELHYSEQGIWPLKAEVLNIFLRELASTEAQQRVMQLARELLEAPVTKAKWGDKDEMGELERAAIIATLASLHRPDGGENEELLKQLLQEAHLLTVPVAKSYAASAIAAAFTSLGRRLEADTWAAQALVLASDPQCGAERAEMLARCCQILKAAGLTEWAGTAAQTALQAVLKEGDRLRRVEAFLPAIDALAAVGDEHGLRQVCKEVEHEEQEVESRRAKGELTTAEKDREQAQRDVMVVLETAKVRARLASGFCRLGDSERGVKIATAFDDSYHDSTLYEIVIELALKDDFNEALDIINQFTDSSQKAAALGVIAERLQESGDAAGAERIGYLSIQTARMVDRSHWRVRAFVRMAAAFLEVGAETRAGAVATRALHEGVSRSSPDTELFAIDILGKLGRFEDAVRLARDRETRLRLFHKNRPDLLPYHPQLLPQVLSRLAKYQQRAGKAEAAAQLSERAIALAHEINPRQPGDKASALIAAAEALAETGRVADAIIALGQARELIKDLAKSWPHSALRPQSALIIAYEKAGAHDAAEQAAVVTSAMLRGYRRSLYSFNYFAAAARAFATAGRQSDAIEAARTALAVLANDSMWPPNGDTDRWPMDGIDNSFAIELILQHGEATDMASVDSLIQVTSQPRSRPPWATQLTFVAEALARTGQVHKASKLCVDALMAMSRNEVGTFFNVVTSGAAALARHGTPQGETLWQAYEAILEVDGWLG